MANPKETLMKAVMTSMKKPASKKMNNAIEVASDEDYPYGLRVDLNKDSLKALGLSAVDFTAGGSLMLKAKCDVISVRTGAGKKRNYESVELQITELALCDKD